jgi:hypothetical protein
VISTYFLNFDNELYLFKESVILQQNICSLNSLTQFFFLYNFLDYNFLTQISYSTNAEASIVDFINQTEEIFFFNNLENIKTIYHYSVPNTKLAYPEPFIASASMMHSDL